MRRLLIITGLIITGLTAFGQADKARQYFGKGYYMIDQRNYPVAIESFLKAIESDSTGDCGTGMKGKAHGELAYAYLRSGDTTKAATYFDKSIALDPTNPFPRQNKAVMLSMQNRNDEAYRLLDELIQLRPGFIDAYVQRGFLYNAENKKDLAIADFKKALELNKKEKILPTNLVDDLNAIIKGKKKK
jgi:tetratricopeptide (TPR) repeat protein